MKDLEPWQLPLSGTALIEASAGTGKTYTLTTLYLRLLVEHDLLPSEILVVTYTQAATAELRERVRERILRAIELGEVKEAEVADHEALDGALGRQARAMASLPGGQDPLRRALREFDEAAIFTIHGFCQRTLERNAFESGVAFDAELIEASELLEQTLARDLWARGIADQEPGFVEWLLQGPGKRYQFEPGALQRDLLRPLGADEEMPILPDPGDPMPDREELAALQSELDAAWRHWAREWPAGRERIQSWLLEAPDLNRRSYNAKSIRNKWLPELAVLCDRVAKRPIEAGRVAFERPDWWKKLTRDGLGSGLKKNGKAIDDPILDAFERVHALSEDLETAYALRALAMRRSFVDRAREAARQRRSERHQLVFDDLLSELRAALRPPEGSRLVEALREQFHFALIDEFQDTDPVQYEIFRTVWHRDAESTDNQPKTGLILIGDPKQAIYSFRDADLFTYLAAREDAADAIYGLGVNWRSDPALIRATNAVFDRPDNAFGFEEVAFHPVRPHPGAAQGLDVSARSSAGLCVLFADVARALDAADRPENPAPGETQTRGELPLRFGRTELMHAFARDIADLLDSDARIGDRRVAPSDIAVLCRRKSELERARRALEALGIPCVDRGDADVFESREGWEMLCVLRAMLRAGDPASLRAALATGAMGWNAAALSTLSDDSLELAACSERFSEYARIWRQSGFMQTFETWRRGEGVTSRLLGYVDGERRMTNWLHLAELLQRVASEGAPSPRGLADWLERAIADPDLRKSFGSDASLLRLESDEDAVSLVTLHRSKGLEYEIVYLPSLWEDTSPRGRSPNGGGKQTPPVRCHDPEHGRRILDLGGSEYEEHLRRQREESLSESLRLFYVGLTRAKRQCVVMWGAIGKGHASTPLAWLLAAPEWEAAGNDRSSAADEIRTWSDQDWRAAWSALGEAAGEGAVSVESADWGPRDRWRSSRESRPALRFDRRTRRMPRARVTTSFSGLTRTAYRRFEIAPGPDTIGRDLDAGVGQVATTPAIEGADPSADLAAEMHLFPRGADAGTLLHDVLERVEFWNWQEAPLRDFAVEALREHGFDSGSGSGDGRYLEQILHVVRSVATTPLRREPEAFRLADVAPGRLRAEMEFTIASASAPRAQGLTPAALSGLLRDAPADSALSCYAERVARLGWARLDGYLRGFIDAVFFDGQRYFLIDYKSNHLGARQVDYAPENLVSAMVEHDYVLQYLIYCVALDRHLSRTLDGYDYAEHFGGAYYLFLRGLSESHAPGCGIFYDRPPEALLRAVSELLGADDRSARVR